MLPPIKAETQFCIQLATFGLAHLLPGLARCPLKQPRGRMSSRLNLHATGGLRQPCSRARLGCQFHINSTGHRGCKTDPTCRHCVVQFKVQQAKHREISAGFTSHPCGKHNNNNLTELQGFCTRNLTWVVRVVLFLLIFTLR